MGDPVRLRLLSLIASHEGGEACVCDLTDVFDLSGPTISPPPQGAARGRADLRRAARDLGLLPGPTRTSSGRLSAVLLPATADGRVHGGRSVSAPRPTRPVVGRLSTLDRFLPVWIVAAMVVGPARPVG